MRDPEGSDGSGLNLEYSRSGRIWIWIGQIGMGQPRAGANSPGLECLMRLPASTTGPVTKVDEKLTPQLGQRSSDCRLRANATVRSRRKASRDPTAATRLSMP